MRKQSSAQRASKSDRFSAALNRAYKKTSGGDAGGYFSHHWQSPEFTYKNKRVRLQGTSFFASPENYRVRMQIAVDDQPFTAYGTLWWRREGSAAPAK